MVYYAGHLAKDRIRMIPDAVKAGWYREERIEPLATLADMVGKPMRAG